MHEKIVTSLFSDSDKAAATVRRIEAAGVPAEHIATFNAGSDRRWDAQHGAPASYAGIPTMSAGESAHDISSWLEKVGVPHHDADAYEEGVRRGGGLVVVSCADDQLDAVIDIVDQEGVVDLDERRTAWASEGWSGREPGAATASGDVVIPVAQEEIHVGKRETAGRVRIHKHVEARPVSEDVELVDERVSVDRRPVDRVATAAEREGLFRDETVEMAERHEEAVVSKDARIREEVVVHKDVDRHRETVTDTVRRTEVDVENVRGADGDIPRR